MKKKIAMVVLGLFFVSALAGCGNKVPADAVATVNGEAIVQDQLDAAYQQYLELYAYYGLDTKDASVQQMIKKTALEQLISQTLLIQEAKSRKLEVTDEEIQTELQTYIDNYYETEEALKSALESYGMTMDDLKKDITDNLLYNKLVEDVVNNAEVDVIKAKHILVETEEEANAMIAELDNGADFAALAKEKSTDAGSAAEGGDVGYFVADMMVQAFSDAAAAQEVGAYSKTPVQSQFGYHIILVEDKKSGVKLSENPDGIYDSIISYENTYGIYNLEDELKEKAEIEYLIDLDTPEENNNNGTEDLAPGENDTEDNTADDQQQTPPADTTQTSGADGQEDTAQ